MLVVAPPATPLPSRSRAHRSEVLAALSHALDLTEGQPAGHAVRSCWIGMRLAEELGLREDERSDLFYTLLVKDAGCSSNAARFASLFGTADGDGKYRMKLADWHRAGETALRTVLTAGRGRGIGARLQHLARIARTPDVARELIAQRGDRGASIATQLGLPAATADAIRHLDEHWSGTGHPVGLAGEDIPLLARIASLAQTLELFFARGGIDLALRTVRHRSGTCFDPRLVRMVEEWRGDREWWTGLSAPDLEARVVAAQPCGAGRPLRPQELDAIARAFAEIVDAKSPFTFRHSVNVAEYAAGIAVEMGLDREQVARLRRAGYLHDIGKLGVPNLILDKPGPLTRAERELMRRHPAHSWEILARVSAFRGFAWTAALHHERLDGSGYPWGLGCRDLGPEARILAVADVYEALTADRAYRAGMKRSAAMEILHREAGAGLWRPAVEALDASLDAAQAAA